MVNVGKVLTRRNLLERRRYEYSRWKYRSIKQGRLVYDWVTALASVARPPTRYKLTA